MASVRGLLAHKPQAHVPPANVGAPLPAGPAPASSGPNLTTLLVIGVVGAGAYVYWKKKKEGEKAEASYRNRQPVQYDASVVRTPHRQMSAVAGTSKSPVGFLAPPSSVSGSTERASPRHTEGGVISREAYSYPDVPRFPDAQASSFRWRPPVDQPPSTVPGTERDMPPFTVVSGDAPFAPESMSESLSNRRSF
jgi:hypothetical protein